MLMIREARPSNTECQHLSHLRTHTINSIPRARNFTSSEYQPSSSSLITSYFDPGGNSNLPSIPPSTMIFTPLTCPLSTGLAITATCLATSSGRATFCNGVVEVARSTKAVSFKVSVAIGVATQPGFTELTRPLGAMRTISFLSVGVLEGESKSQWIL